MTTAILAAVAPHDHLRALGDAVVEATATFAGHAVVAISQGAHGREMLVSDPSSMLGNPDRLVHMICNAPFGMGISMMKDQMRQTYVSSGATQEQVDALPMDEFADCLCSGLDLSDPSIADLAAYASPSEDGAPLPDWSETITTALPIMLNADNFCNRKCKEMTRAFVRAMPIIAASSSSDRRLISRDAPSFELDASSDSTASTAVTAGVLGAEQMLSELAGIDADVSDCICQVDSQRLLAAFVPYMSSSSTPAAISKEAAELAFSNSGACASGCQPVLAMLVATTVREAHGAAKAGMRHPNVDDDSILDGMRGSIELPPELSADVIKPLATQCICAGGSWDYAALVALGGEARSDDLEDDPIAAIARTGACSIDACTAIGSALLHSLPDEPTNTCDTPTIESCTQRCSGDCERKQRDGVDSEGTPCSSYCLPTCGLGFGYVDTTWWQACGKFHECAAEHASAGPSSGGADHSMTLLLTIVGTLAVIALVALGALGVTKMGGRRPATPIVNLVATPGMISSTEAPLPSMPRTNYDMELNPAAVAAQEMSQQASGSAAAIPVVTGVAVDPASSSTV